jgi:hypothetical protein
MKTAGVGLAPRYIGWRPVITWLSQPARYRQGIEGTESGIELPVRQPYPSWFVAPIAGIKLPTLTVFLGSLKVHKIAIFFGCDFEICIISLLVM